jgi:hypothetical protein
MVPSKTAGAAQCWHGWQLLAVPAKDRRTRSLTQTVEGLGNIVHYRANAFRRLPAASGIKKSTLRLNAVARDRLTPTTSCQTVLPSVQPVLAADGEGSRHTSVQIWFMPLRCRALLLL